MVPAGPQVVLERLPRGYAALMPTAPSATPASALETARALLDAAARTGDFRLAARADALLSRFPPGDNTPALLSARAFSAQHRHDFTAALRFLDRLVAQLPRDGDARLSRAQVHLVQGRLDKAREDCTALVGIDVGDGLLCVASLSLRRGDHDSAADLLDRWIAQSLPTGGSSRYALVLRAEIAARARDADTERWFQRALALDGADVRTLAAYARYLRSVGRDREVEALLAGKTDNDGLQLQRALAAYRIDPVQARTLVQAQAARYALAHQVGSQPEMRDEAEFLLTLRGQAGPALALALANFQDQRDYEDVDILQRSAEAAGRDDALAPMRQWAAAQRLPLPARAKP